MEQTGINKCYSGKEGEIRSSRFYSLKKDFKDKSYLSFKYVLKGQENYEVEGSKFEINTGQALFFSYHKPYKGYINYPNITEGLCIDLKIDLGLIAQMDVLNEEQLFLFSPEFKTQKINFLEDNFRSLLQNISKGNSIEQSFRYEEILQDISANVIKMEKEYVERMKSVPNKNKAYKKEVFIRLIKARNYIQDYKYQKIKLAEIAKESGLSSFYLHRLFKQVFGCTPAQYQEEVRMQDAKKLLKTHSVNETSYLLGFTDAPYFSKRFKYFYGISPGKYSQLKR